MAEKICTSNYGFVLHNLEGTILNRVLRQTMNFHRIRKSFSVNSIKDKWCAIVLVEQWKFEKNNSALCSVFQCEALSLSLSKMNSAHISNGTSVHSLLNYSQANREIL